jgi:hypothetical protein
MTPLTATAWILASLCVIALGYWVVVAVRVHRMMAIDPSVRKGLRAAMPEGGWPTLSVIVPAHNEEAMIDRCAESLRAQDYPDIEIIFVCDRCTDETVARARRHAKEDARVIVVENDACPAEWAGKCHAAQIGAAKATGRWLIFTDADTQFDPSLCRAAVGLAMQDGLSLLSLLTTLATRHRFERIVQPVASMNLVRLYPLRRVNRLVRPRPFANGQFMLFDRAVYDQVGGHAAVRNDLLEDIAIAWVVSRAGGRVGVYFADGMLTCAMYESFAAFRTGWKRIYIEACHRKPARLRKLGWSAITAGVVGPLAQLAAVGAAIALWPVDAPLAAILLSVVATGWIVQFATLMRIFGISGAPRLAAFGYPLGNYVVGRIMLEAARDLSRGRPILWGGREYVLEAR